MSSSAASQLASLEHALAKAGTAKRAVGAKAYLKSDKEFLGTSVPDLRREVRAWAKQHECVEHEDVIGWIAPMWASTYFEVQLALVELLRFRVSVLDLSDFTEVANLIRSAQTWALVDPLSTDVAGLVVARPDLCKSREARGVLDAWSSDESFWLRRASMLSLLPQLRKRDANPGQFFGYADSMLNEQEFFIRKAIGWVLRELSKRQPDVVFDWSMPRVAMMSGVTYREAIKYLSPQQRDQLAKARA